MTPTSPKRKTSLSDLGAYAYFVLSTGTFQTYSAWRSAGRANPFAGRDYRSDMVTRTQIVEIFFHEA